MDIKHTGPLSSQQISKLYCGYLALIQSEKGRGRSVNSSFIALVRTKC
jgi:hypothetical protein